MNLINQFSEFATKNPWGVTILSISGVIGTILGFVGIWLSIAAWKDDQKSKREFNYLLKLAEKNIDKSITEQEIEQKRQQLDEISDKVTSLQDQIKKEIPIEARRAVLQDRLNSSIEILTKYYNDVKSTQQQLEKLGKPQQVPEEILREIEAEIQPNYILKEKISYTKTALSAITGLAAIASAIFPYPTGDWIRNLLLLVAIPAAIQLVKLSILTRQDSDPLVKQLLVLSLSLFNLLIIIVSLLAAVIFSGSYFTLATRILVPVFSFSVVLMTNFISGLVYKRYIKHLYLGTTNNRIIDWCEKFFNKSLYSVTINILAKKKSASKAGKQRSSK